MGVKQNIAQLKVIEKKASKLNREKIKHRIDLYADRKNTKF